MTLTLSGSVGASIGIEVGANMKGDSIKGIPGKAADNGEGAPGRRKINIAKALDDSDVKAELSVFVGAESGANVDGALKWKNPEKSNDFKQLAKIGVGLAAQAGAGFSALLAFSYKDGKIRCHVKAGLCWGKGAKGSTSLEVDIKAIYEEFVPCGVYAEEYGLCQTPRDNEGRGLLCILFTDVVGAGNWGITCGWSCRLGSNSQNIN